MLKSFRFMLTTVVVFLLLMASPSFAATMTGWNVGWNNMATLSGGTIDFGISSIGNLQYISIDGANVSFSTADFWDGYFTAIAYSWADASGDQGQHFFDGTLRNSWYGGAVPLLTAYDWDGANGQPANGEYEWLLNNYNRDGQGNSVGTPKNSWIRGTGSSFTYNQDTGEFVANMTSTGTWYWYTPTTPDSPMPGWIQNFDWSWDTAGDFSDYYLRYMTGNFRIIGTFEDDAGGLPTFATATLQYEVSVIPEPGTIALLGIGLAGLGLYRYRRKNKA